MRLLHIAIITLALMLCIGAVNATPLKISGTSNGNAFVTTISPAVQHPDGYVKVTSFIGSTRTFDGIRIRTVTVTSDDIPYSVHWYKK